MVKLNYNNYYNKVRLYSMASYLGPLFILGRIFNNKKDSMIDFHSWHGGILFLMVTFLYNTIRFIENLLFMSPIFAEVVGVLLHIGVFTLWIVLTVMGLVNAYKMEVGYLPLIGWIDNILRKHYQYK